MLGAKQFDDDAIVEAFVPSDFKNVHRNFIITRFINSLAGEYVEKYNNFVNEML